MPYLLDTNIVIHAMEGMEAVLDKLVENDGNVLLSVLSLIELQRGIHRDPKLLALRQTWVADFTKSVTVLPFDVAAVEAYAEIIAQRGWVRSRDFDRMIAAHAISSKSVLVTDDTRDFTDIPDLELENWAQP